MIGFRFSKFKPGPEQRSPFDRLLNLFLQLLTYTAGDANEALQWMNELDREHGLTDNEYSMGDFVEDLKRKGYLRDDTNGGLVMTPKAEQSIRKSALEEVFGKLRRSAPGRHSTRFTGIGEEPTGDLREYRFGDTADQISMTESIRNAQINHGLLDFHLMEDDLEVSEREHQSQTSTVLMIDISHSMILYGEDRITPAKKVAMALAELIRIRFPKDTLDVIVFGDDAWPISVKDLPYLQVGPYHTNTPAGLELAMDLLRRRKNPNKQIFMITDGKPTCLKIGKNYYKNSFGLDRKIVNRCLNLAMRCKKLNVPITTFMIARDPYLVRFIEAFTQTNNGKAFYSSLEGLGSFVLENYKKRKKK